MAEGVRRLTAERLTADRWSPFGWLPVADTDPRDATFTYEFEWGDAHVNVISHSAEEVARVEDRLVCDRFYRHDTHTQTLLALDVDSVVVVAPAAVSFATPSELDSVCAFAIAPLDGFALHRGTWHWGPFPTGGAPVHLWNLQGKRYTEDNACVELRPALGITFEISR
ncbi:MAG: ureidoglycolate lyase [Acidimicrobiia bacterium]